MAGARWLVCELIAARDVAASLPGKNETIFPLASRNDAAVKQAAPIFEPAVDYPALGQSTRIHAFAGADSTLDSVSIRS